MAKKVIVGMASDHAGYKLKEHLKPFLEKMGYKVKDFGTHSEESMDYPDTAHPLAFAVENKDVDFGVAMCGSGNGITMTLNKHQGVRAALCWTPELGALAKQHNNANVLSLPARFISEAEAEEIVKAYLNAEFEGGRHQRRIDKIPVAKEST
ncbi:MAG: ribose 5-phosphate isomerase B [Bacteroidales bacterium]|nr:ribose 5-phosphate isomerase B [Bacteroidales bacterium]